MAVTHERFEKGLTYEEYREQMTRNRDRFEENERLAQLDPKDVQFFAQLPQPLHVLVLAEDWCGDVINNLPVIGQLVKASDKLNLRIFLRDQNLDIMDQYLNEGVHRSIPVVVFFDQDFRELGHWIERPASISKLMHERIGKLYETDPALAGISRDLSPAQLPEEARNRLIQEFGVFRNEVREQSDREVVRELRELVAAGLAQVS